MGFAAFRVPSNVASRLAKMNIVAPTAVQKASLDLLMPRSPSQVAAPPAPHHAVIRWPTGSGKTLAYALPLLARIEPNNCGQGVQALIVTPTRELCLQTFHTMRKLTDYGRPNRKGNFIKVSALMGRRSTKLDNEMSNRPPDIAIGTPQTLASLLRAELLPLCAASRRRTLVLDEVGALCEDFRWPSVSSVLHGGSDSARAFSQGSIWFVSAHVPAGTVERCLEAAGTTRQADVTAAPSQRSTRLATPRAVGSTSSLVQLEAEEIMPSTIRHVALQPGTPLAPTLAELVDWRHANGGADRSVGGRAGGEGGEGGADGGESLGERGGSGDVEGHGGEWSLAEARLERSGDAPSVGADDHRVSHQGARQGAHQSAHHGVDAERVSGGREMGGAAAAAAGEEGGAMEKRGRSTSTSPKALVFVSSGAAADQLRKTMRNRRVSAAAVHAADGRSSAAIAPLDAWATLTPTLTLTPSLALALTPALTLSLALALTPALTLTLTPTLALTLTLALTPQATGKATLHADTYLTCSRRVRSVSWQRRRWYYSHPHPHPHPYPHPHPHPRPHPHPTRTLTLGASPRQLAYGVDIRGASHVLNAQVPASATSYLHRAGRVGRTGGTTGTVISLPRDQSELRRLRGFAKDLGFELEVHDSLRAATAAEVSDRAL